MEAMNCSVIVVFPVVSVACQVAVRTETIPMFPMLLA